MPSVRYSNNFISSDANKTNKVTNFYIGSHLHYQKY